EEIDIEAILKRKPHIVLIDELAHINAFGSRHKKRYQDILEILDYGIDVYTTLNIHNIESLAPAIEEITGIKINDTIPDSILESADNIEIVDITNDELLTRLNSGKIFPLGKPQSIKNSFFNKGNLTALREMLFHYTASLIKKDIIEYKQAHLIDKSWKTAPNLLVAISPSPTSEYLIRWTKRTAFDQKIPWSAVYVETDKKLTAEQSRTLEKNIKLVKELGAELITTIDDNIPKGIIRTARQKNVSQIVVGKPYPGTLLRFFLKKNIIDKLIQESGEIDILMISEKKIKSKLPPFLLDFITSESSFKEYALVIFGISILTALNIILNKYINYFAIGLIYLAAVSIVSAFLKKGPIFLFSTLSAVLWNFLFIPPSYTFLIDRVEDLFMFIMYFISALITGNLTSQLKVKELFLRNKEKNLEELYQMSKILNETSNINEIIGKSLNYLKKVFLVKFSIFLFDDNLNLSRIPFNGSDFVLPDNEWKTALWCYENKKSAGKKTDTMSMSKYFYIPLLSQAKIFGVMAIDYPESFNFNNERLDLLTALSGQIAIAIERNELIKTYQKIIIEEESDKLYQILLNSVSHELKTPITTISTSANGLIDKKLSSDKKVRDILTNDIIDGVERLNRLVDNLLGILHIESKKIQLNLEWNDITEVVNIVAKKLKKLMVHHSFIVNIDKEIPMLKFDFRLMEQLFTNLIHNAILYTPKKVKLKFKFITG
ncbi:MAG: sensor histidine kinase KdpD, partial [Spirochaetes bacterium]|nr:sensor histidine kinase KdpD [Spirochaetota bacterium]